MKFLAAVLITNSHMVSVYPEKYSMLATGGAIGDALFFFCSGFLLMMARGGDFFNWYKRRINRIFPAIFAAALVGIVLFSKDPTLKEVILHGGGWFVQAIFVFYALFWFVKRFLSDKLWIAIAAVSAVILVWFIWFWDKSVFILYNDTYLRWPCFFLVMLLGAAVSKREKERQADGKKQPRGLVWLALLAGLLALYFGYQLLQRRMPLLDSLQIVLLPVLMGIIYCFYRLCANAKVVRAYRSKYIYWAVYAVSACCLEVYLCGKWFFGLGSALQGCFPLNVLLTFLLIFVAAYLLKVLGNFLSQTFKTEPYDWKKMTQL